MAKDVRVIIVEDDPYARDLMTLLLARDWRTRVVADVRHEAEAVRELQTAIGRVDVVLYDTEIPGSPAWPRHLYEQISSVPNPPAFLCTGTCFDSNIYNHILEAPRGGYILKNDVRYTLAWAVVLAAAGDWVITPGVLEPAQQQSRPLTRRATLLNGSLPFPGLTDREREIARLAILLNMARRNLADELQISPDWAFEMVSVAYQKLGLSEVISGETTPESFLENNPVILDSFRDILSHYTPVKGARKGMDMDTLAFHLMTIPDVQILE